jgi:hypothetical protein
MIEPVSVISEAPARAMPKSVTLSRSSGPTITLCGLKSRWITPRRCANDAAWRIWIASEITRVCASGASSRITSLSVLPARYSIAM